MLRSLLGVRRVLFSSVSRIVHSPAFTRNAHQSHSTFPVRFASQRVIRDSLNSRSSQFTALAQSAHVPVFRCRALHSSAPYSLSSPTDTPPSSSTANKTDSSSSSKRKEKTKQTFAFQILPRFILHSHISFPQSSGKLDFIFGPNNCIKTLKLVKRNTYQSI